MVKKIKLKKIENVVDSDGYVSNIEDIIGEVKNITLKVTIIDIFKLELEDGIIVVTRLKDNSGIISAILVVDRESDYKEFINNISANNMYIVKGNSVILREPTDNDLDIIKEKLKGIININDIYLVITSIQKIN